MATTWLSQSREFVKYFYLERERERERLAIGWLKQPTNYCAHTTYTSSRSVNISITLMWFHWWDTNFHPDCEKKRKQEQERERESGGGDKLQFENICLSTTLSV